MTDSIRTTARNNTSSRMSSQVSDAEMEPYLSLFLKPLTRKKSEFSRHELEVMCKDPLHSPRLIQYLIDSIREK